MRNRYHARNRNRLIILSICCFLVTGILVSQLLIRYKQVDKVKDSAESTTEENQMSKPGTIATNDPVNQNITSQVLDAVKEEDKESDQTKKQDSIDENSEAKAPEIDAIEPIASSENNEDVVSADTVPEPKIMSSTRIEYQNYYQQDDKLEIEKDMEPPYYMLNLTRAQVEEFYPEFQLIAFSKEKVVLRRIINDHSDKYYIIKKHNNKVGVFNDYRDDGDQIHIEDYLRDMVDIPTNGLVWEEQAKLKEGITVYGEEELTEEIKKLHALYKFNESGEYIIKEYKGTMGIFYNFMKDEAYKDQMKQEQLNALLEKYLRKTVDAPISDLEADIVEKLKEGIKVNGELELIQLLENYTS